MAVYLDLLLEQVSTHWMFLTFEVKKTPRLGYRMTYLTMIFDHSLTM